MYFTIRLKVLQITKLGLAIKYIFQKEEGEGDVSAFASLCTALAATIGTGSIVGVATALRAGGPGALFWMWVSAFLGMATKYAEGLLAVKYRSVDENGQICGGPMYYIQNGMGEKWKWLAKLFAFFGIMTAMLGCGTFPQVGCVVLGGIKSISSAAELIVPFMAMFYVLGSLLILILHAQQIPETLKLIVTSAFTPHAAVGGAAGTVFISVMTAMRTGVARGVYTNEAGLGSSPIVVAAAKTKSCVRQGLVSMTSVFFTTIVICTMTGIVVITSGYLDVPGLDGGKLSNAAYNSGLPGNLGMYMVSIGLIFFAFTTIISWCYYGERCLVYLCKSVKWIFVYKVLYIACVAAAPYLELQPIWLLADITNACMAFPNLIGLLGLSSVVIKETRDYFAELKPQR